MHPPGAAGYLSVSGRQGGEFYGQWQSAHRFPPKNGPVNALWLGGSGSAAIAPNSGTLRTIIETMKKSAKALYLWFAMGVVGLFSATANATTVIPPTFEELTDRAELVFVGKVVSSRSEWRTVGTKRVIFTLVEFERQEVLKGQAGTSVTLQFLGGTVGDMTLEVAGVPKFNIGDREILFVEGNGVQFCPLVGVFHGKFGVRKDEMTGREIVLMHNGKPLRDLGEIGTGVGAEFGPKRPKPTIPADRAPMSPGDFKTMVREHLLARADQK